MENRSKGTRPHIIEHQQASEETSTQARLRPPLKVHDRHTISGLLQALDFPASRWDVIQRFGKVELLWNEEEPIMIDDIMVDIHQERFDDLTELTDAICANLRLAFGDFSAENQVGILGAERGQ